MDLPRLMFINKECENLKVVVDGGEFTRNNKERKSQKFYKPIDVHSVANAIEKVEVSMVKFVVIFFCGQIGNKY